MSFLVTTKNGGKSKETGGMSFFDLKDLRNHYNSSLTSDKKKKGRACEERESSRRDCLLGFSSKIL